MRMMTLIALTPCTTEVLEKQQTQAARLQGRKKKHTHTLTARVKCQHYHRFLIGCFPSFFLFFPLFTFAQNEQFFSPAVHCQIENIKSIFSAFGSLTDVHLQSARLRGCWGDKCIWCNWRRCDAQPRLKASTPSWQSDAAHRSHSATNGFEATTEKSQEPGSDCG